MNKATQLRYNMESLCIYQFKTDPVMHSLLHLLRSIDDGEAVLEAQSAFSAHWHLETRCAGIFPS